MSVTLNEGSSPLWIEDGVILPQRCQGSCRHILETHRSLSPEARKQPQEDIQSLNAEISEKYLWRGISLDVCLLQKSLANCENGKKDEFLLIYEKLNKFFNRQNLLKFKAEQWSLINTFHRISNEFTEIEKRREKKLWEEIEEDLKGLEERFSSCKGEEKNNVFRTYEQLKNFFVQLDVSTLNREQKELLDRLYELEKDHLDLIKEHHQIVCLTEKALSSLTSLEAYLSDISEESVSQEQLSAIMGNYKGVVENIKKQAFFICLEVLQNVNERLSVIQKRLASFKVSQSPTSMTYSSLLL